MIASIPPLGYIELLLVLSVLLFFIGLILTSVGSRFAKRVLWLSLLVFLVPIAIVVIPSLWR